MGSAPLVNTTVEGWMKPLQGCKTFVGLLMTLSSSTWTSSSMVNSYFIDVKRRALPRHVHILSGRSTVCWL